MPDETIWIVTNDVATMKLDAINAELNKNLELAEQLWIRVLAASPGDDMDAIEGIQRIALSKQEHPKSATPEPDPANTRNDYATPKLTFDTVTVDAQGKENYRYQGHAEFFSEYLGNGVNLVMVAIPKGRFRMGSPETEKMRFNCEGPQHEVAIAPFFLGQFPVTQAQWKRVATLPRIDRDLDSDFSNFQSSPFYSKGEDRPLEWVDWEDAVEFCRRLSQATKRNYRLPSEAEWEYACRAGTTGPFHFGETINTDFANYNGHYLDGSAVKGTFREETTPVGSFGVANAFGLCDMHGNVFEWCQDVWHDNYRGAPADGTAWESGGDNSYRVLRGGSWKLNPFYCRSAYRDSTSEDDGWRDRGFRVAVSSVSPSS
ncbi:formylglycine-generating enzyme family protein [Microcoleus sp. D2_18a_B4]|uniref:formylglycine-generating enzyme family protein n=1 Tax=Microcoleus sp. D2_18a_B4 TaxID=3055329 RepID=UPI002FCE7FF8